MELFHPNLNSFSMNQAIRLFCASIFILSLFSHQQLHSQALPIKKEGKWGAIDAKGNIVIAPQYESLSNFDPQGWAAFRKEGKAGVVSEKGEEIIPAEYEQVRPLSKEFVAIWKEGRCGMVNVENKEIIAPSFDNIDTLTSSLFRVHLNGKYGITNNRGEAVLAAVHEQMGTFEGENTVAILSKEGKKGLLFLSSNRTEITTYEPVYDEVKQVEDGSFLAYKGPQITQITLDEKGIIATEQTFNNETAYLLAKDQATKKRIASTEANPQKPRWVRNGFQYQLANGFGNKFLGGKSFFQLSVDEEQGLAMGVLENEQEEDECYIIHTESAKVLLQIKAKDLVITDFRNSEYARITIDTLYDGLVNKSGEIIKEVGGQAISNIGNFNDGLAYVQCGSQYGFVNTSGKLAIPLAYEIVSDFKNGYAIGRKNGKFGCFNTEGTVVIPFEYDGIDTPTEGVLRVKQGRGRQGKWGLINLKNETVAPFDYTIIGPIENGEAVARQGRKLGIINTQGKVVVPIAIEVDYLGSFENGIAPVGMERMVENMAGRPEVRYKYQGYVNRDGQMLIPPKYEFIYDFDSVYQAGAGLAKVVLNAKVGYLNAKGQVVVEPQYDAIEGFEEAYMKQQGLAKIREGNKFGYINFKGTKVLEPAYSFVDGFERALSDTTLLAKVGIDGKFGYINYDEKPIIPLIYDLVSPVFGSSIIVEAQGKQGLLSTANDTLLPIAYDGIKLLPESQNQLLLLYQARATQVAFNGNGQVVRTQLVSELSQSEEAFTKNDKYKYITAFDGNGLAVIQDSKGRRGLINRQGKEVVKPDYQEIGEFSEGLAPFKLDHKDRSKQLWGFLDIQGNEVIEAKYRSAEAFGSERGLVLDNRQWGYVDRNGNMVIKAQYRQAQPFSGGYAVVNQNQIIDANGKLQGKFVLEKGEIISGFSSGRAIAEVPSGQLHIRPNGQPVYYATYDEVTPYIGEVAFVKKGEVWNLVRKVGEREVAIPFSKAGMRQYKAEYGNRDKKTTKEGVVIKDIKWELAKPGVWRMIDAQGYFIGSQIYQKVEFDLQKQEFTTEIPATVGLANLKGEILLPANQEQIKVTDAGLIQVNAFGKIGYLDLQGNWVWELGEY